MSDPTVDPQRLRSAAETRLWEVGQKPQAPAVPAARSEAKPAAEPKAVAEAKVVTEPKPNPIGSVFGPTLRFKGELRAKEDFVLQGRIEGSIHHTQNLTIGTDGVVKGDSRARSIVVDGTVEGDLYALESISIHPTARVQGNLMAPRVAIADGATFNGKVDMASATRAARSIVERQSTPLGENQVDPRLSAGAEE